MLRDEEEISSERWFSEQKFLVDPEGQRRMAGLLSADRDEAVTHITIHYNY